MNSQHLQTFISGATERSRSLREPADCVLAIAPLMFDLLEHDKTFLLPQHYRSSADGYTRNLIYEAPDDSLSLYSIVWRPGQWTPVHDHGSWGVVGVVDGVLEERSYVRLSPDRGSDADIDLVRGGTILLRHGPSRASSRIPITST
jgi:predicted metal-dependent enzyme (double-stranded beta helix superfamily)